MPQAWLTKTCRQLGKTRPQRAGFVNLAGGNEMYLFRREKKKKRERPIKIIPKQSDLMGAMNHWLHLVVYWKVRGRWSWGALPVENEQIKGK